MITLDPHDGDLGMSAWVDEHEDDDGAQRQDGLFATPPVLRVEGSDD